MSTNSPLKTIQDGLVLYFDNNNPKSYIGEPTTNLNSDPLGLSGNPGSVTWGGYEYNITRTNDLPIPSMAEISPYWIKCVCNGPSSGRAAVLGVSGLSTGVDYCISCYVYSSNSNITTVGWNSHNSGVSTDSSAVTYGSSDTLSVKRIYRIFRSVAGSQLEVLQTNTSVISGDTFYVTGIQCEQKSYPTQLVNGNRSATQGLVDLTKTNTINLSNTAFDSNARITFNNSTSYINTGCILNGSTYTKFAWFNTNNLSAANNIVSGGTNGQHAFWLAVGNKLNAGHNGSWSTVQSSTTISTNTWYFGAASFSTSTGWRLYLNGSMEASSVSTTTFTGTTMPTLIGSYDYGNLFSGTIDMVGIYNKVLSDADVLQLYLRTKSRYRL